MMATSDRNLAQLSALLQSLAEGDLTVRMDGDFHGVFAACAMTPTPPSNS